MEHSEIQNRIRRLIEQGMAELSPELRAWAESHLTFPRRVQLLDSLDTQETSSYWLITDRTGVNDSSYRVVYDERHDTFGFEVTLEDDRELFLGRVGSFAETVRDL
ncbi:MAG: hypothetical protein M3362_04855 [Acidobacteriota bacterium]|nr:hypothetical protein [Acidobacteriota bacterium]